MKSYMKVSKLKRPDGEFFLVSEVREHTWGKSIHSVKHPEYSTVGSRFVPILLTREQLEEALK